MSKYYYEELKNYAPVGVLKEAFRLYEQQTREYIKNGIVNKETYNKILIFAHFCTQNGYDSLVVLPLDYSELAFNVFRGNKNE